MDASSGDRSHRDGIRAALVSGREASATGKEQLGDSSWGLLGSTESCSRSLPSLPAQASMAIMEESKPAFTDSFTTEANSCVLSLSYHWVLAAKNQMINAV